MVRDGTTFTDLVDTAVTRSYGDILIRNFKSEIAPDSGYVIYADGNGSIRMTDLKISSYTRTSTDWYRWGCFHGGVEIDVQEWNDTNARLANPAVPVTATVLSNASAGTNYVAGNPGDYGLFRCYGTTRITLPSGVTVPNFTRYVIDGSGNPVTGNGQVYMEATSGPNRVMTNLVLASVAYNGNDRLQVLNTTPTDVRSTAIPFSVDGAGNTAVNVLTSPPVNTSYIYDTSTIGVDWSFGMHQSCTLTLSGNGGSNTITLLGAVAGSWYTLEISQDSTGGRTASFSNSNIRWQNGTTPVLSTGAKKTDIFRFYFDGTSYFGQVLLGF